MGTGLWLFSKNSSVGKHCPTTSSPPSWHDRWGSIMAKITMDDFFAADEATQDKVFAPWGSKEAFRIAARDDIRHWHMLFDRIDGFAKAVSVWSKGPAADELFDDGRFTNREIAAEAMLWLQVRG